MYNIESQSKYKGLNKESGMAGIDGLSPSIFCTQENDGRKNTAASFFSTTGQLYMLLHQLNTQKRQIIFRFITDFHKTTFNPFSRFFWLLYNIP